MLYKFNNKLLLFMFFSICFLQDYLEVKILHVVECYHREGHYFSIFYNHN